MSINKIDRVVLATEVLKDLDGKATKQELTNAQKNLENTINEVYQGIVWKPTVPTFNDLSIEYAGAEDGWTATVEDTNYTYQYNATDMQWFPTSINALPNATPSVDGLMSIGDKVKLDTIEQGAHVNRTPDELFQVIKTKDGKGSGLDADLIQGRPPSSFANKEHNHDGRYNTKAELSSLLNGKSNTNHKHIQADITDFAHKHNASDVTDFSDGVKGTILSGFSTLHSGVVSATDTILSALGKIQKQITDNLGALNGHKDDKDNPHTVTKSQVGLGKVDNTADKDKPVSTPTNTALNKKVDKIIGKELSDNNYTDGDRAEVAKIKNKANKVDIPTKNSQLTNDTDYVTSSELGDAGLGDMTKAVYDKNNSGVVDKAKIANSVVWGGVSGKPSAFTPSSHTHVIGDISGLGVELEEKETPSGAQAKATKSLSDAKVYVDNKVKTDVPMGAKFTDTVYNHPSTHPYSMITGTPSKLSDFTNDISTYHKGSTPISNTKKMWLDTSV